MVSRPAFMAMLAVFAAGVIWIEHAQRIDIRAHEAINCPDNENVPYGTTCLGFIETVATRIDPPEANTDVPAPAPRDPAPTLSEADRIAPDPACPDNDSAPYGARCLKFLSGWPWRANVQ